MVLTTVADMRTARRLSRGLVTARLAACVTVVPGVVSCYRWKRKLERSHEALLIIKTNRKSWPKLSAYVRKRHPYELPELIALPVLFGLKEYLSWLSDSLR